MKCSGTVTGVLPVNRVECSRSACQSARRIFSGRSHWGGLVPSLVREYRYDSAGNVQASPAGKITDGKHGGSTGWTERPGHGGDSLRHRAGLWRRDESYGYDSCGYLKAQSAGRHG